MAGVDRRGRTSLCSTPQVGGLSGLVAKIAPATLAPACPTSATGSSRSAIFIIPLTVQWWSVWYPGAEPGGGSYIAQRMLAARVGAATPSAGTLFFNVAHYALRPWPWIIVALCSLLVFPTLGDIQPRLPARRPRRSSATTWPTRPC